MSTIRRVVKKTPASTAPSRKIVRKVVEEVVPDEEVVEEVEEEEVAEPRYKSKSATVNTLANDPAFQSLIRDMAFSAIQAYYASVQSASKRAKKVAGDGVSVKTRPQSPYMYFRTKQLEHLYRDKSDGKSIIIGLTAAEKEAIKKGTLAQNINTIITNRWAKIKNNPAEIEKLKRRAEDKFEKETGHKPVASRSRRIVRSPPSDDEVDTEPVETVEEKKDDGDGDGEVVEEETVDAAPTDEGEIPDEVVETETPVPAKVTVKATAAKPKPKAKAADTTTTSSNKAIDDFLKQRGISLSDGSDTARSTKSEKTEKPEKAEKSEKAD